MKKLIYFIILIFIATIIIIIDNAFIYKHSQVVAEDVTKLQALGIAVSLEAALKDYDLNMRQPKIFKDIINDGKWEGIAFIGLYASNGLIMLHSNENLIGRTVNDDILKMASEKGEIIYEYIRLGTGERVFTINMPIHTIKKTSNPILRVAIHTFQMERLKGIVRIKVIAMFVVLTILWLFGIFLFISQKKELRLKEKMIQKERFAHIGEMASVLAHEIRNPLGSIKGFAQYLNETTKDNKQKDALEIIIAESSRLEVLTDELLTYARPIELKLESINISSIVQDTIRKLVYDFKDINFIVKGKSEKNINTDRDKIIQILINILNNSIDAIENKGSILIELEDSDKGVVISVKDSGTGIKEEILEKIFNPFFTTKTKGTGLGLSIVKKLIDSLEGTIDIKNLKPNGVEVRLFIKDIKGNG